MSVAALAGNVRMSYESSKGVRANHSTWECAKRTLANMNYRATEK